MRICRIEPDNKRDIRRFIQFPFQLYKDNPYWVPTLKSEMESVFDRHKHPFYQTSQADFFLAESEGSVLGRMAVLKNRQYCDYYHQNIGFFYYLDFIDDKQMLNQLISTALEWGRKNNLAEYHGPRGFLRANGVGILVEGFNNLPAMGSPYNWPYYGPCLEDYGFEKISDLHSGYIVPSYEMPKNVVEAAERIRNQNGFQVLKFKHKKELSSWIDQIGIVYDEAFKENPNYYPSTTEEFALIAKTIYQVADPRLVKIIVKGDRIAGFVLAYPNISRALQKTKGNIWPFGWLSILTALKTSRTIDLNGIGFLPQHQGRGANILVYAELEKTLRHCKTEYCNLVQVDERNYKSKSDMDKMGVTWNKRHRLYRLKI